MVHFSQRVTVAQSQVLRLATINEGKFENARRSELWFQLRVQQATNKTIS